MKQLDAPPRQRLLTLRIIACGRWHFLLQFRMFALLILAATACGCIASAMRDSPVECFTIVDEHRFSVDRLKSSAESLLAAIKIYETEGFSSGAYRFKQLQAETAAEPPNASRLFLEVRNSFSSLVEHALNGRIDPRRLAGIWADAATREKADIHSLFEAFLETQRFDFDAIEPQDRRFRDLRTALDTYERLASSGGWLRVDADSSDEVLRQRLAVTGDLRSEEPNDTTVETRDAIARFQRRHGLQPDGVLGKETIRALNVPLTTRIAQIRANLERWRWLPRSLGQDYVEVNIPAFQLDSYESGRPRFRTRAIVGKKSRPTPVLLSELKRLEINPSWNVPRSIASRELLPLLQKDPEYLARHHMVLLSPDGKAVKAPRSWHDFSPANFPFRIRQIPGPWNAVGKLKFIFPSRFGVYVHGTPMSELFEKRCRDFSHGCIRIEDPVSFAGLVLTDRQFTAEKIQAEVDKGRTVSIAISRRLPIYLSYWTSWVDDEGELHFAEDLYGGDSLLIALLERKQHEGH